MSFTANAIIELARIAKLKNCGSIRVGVKGGGCSGFELVIQPEYFETNDRHFFFDDVTVVIDERSEEILKNVKIDYEVSLVRRSFVVSGPKIASKCGCGLSFDLKDD